MLHPSYRLSPIADTGPNPLSQAGITRKQEVRSLRPQLPGSCVLGQLRTWTSAFSLTSQGSPHPLAGIIQPSPTPYVCSRIWFLPCSQLSLTTRVLAWHPSSQMSPCPWTASQGRLSVSPCSQRRRSTLPQEPCCLPVPGRIQCKVSSKDRLCVQRTPLVFEAGSVLPPRGMTGLTLGPTKSLLSALRTCSSMP